MRALMDCFCAGEEEDGKDGGGDGTRKSGEALVGSERERTLRVLICSGSSERWS